MLGEVGCLCGSWLAGRWAGSMRALSQMPPATFIWWTDRSLEGSWLANPRQNLPERTTRLPTLGQPQNRKPGVPLVAWMFWQWASDSRFRLVVSDSLPGFWLIIDHRRSSCLPPLSAMLGCGLHVASHVSGASKLVGCRHVLGNG